MGETKSVSCREAKNGYVVSVDRWSDSGPSSCETYVGHSKEEALRAAGEKPAAVTGGRSVPLSGAFASTIWNAKK